MTLQNPRGSGAGPAGTPARVIRVLIASRSARLRARIAAALDQDGRTTVVAEADNGRAAVDRCEDLRPDVLILDPMLSATNSVEVTEHLMKRCPTPILIVSDGSEGDLAAVRACMAAGAVDVFARPAGPGDQQLREWNRALLAAVTVVARIRVVTQHAPRRPPGPTVLPATPDLLSPGPNRVIAIGASTGGPAAITAVLAGLPRSPAVPILLVLHVNQSFHPSLTRWLRDTTGHRVRSAEHGEPVSAATGCVLTAPPGRHLEVSGGLLILSDEPPRHSCKPSIDVLFGSIAREFGPHGAACLLTGMGRDGAAGLLEIRRAGGITIAQDEATSVVYGMPAEAARLGAAQRILPIDQIGAALSGLASDQRIAGAP